MKKLFGLIIASITISASMSVLIGCGAPEDTSGPGGSSVGLLGITAYDSANTKIGYVVSIKNSYFTILNDDGQLIDLDWNGTPYNNISRLTYESPDCTGDPIIEVENTQYNHAKYTYSLRGQSYISITSNMGYSVGENITYNSILYSSGSCVSSTANTIGIKLQKTSTRLNGILPPIELVNE